MSSQPDRLREGLRLPALGQRDLARRLVYSLLRPPLALAHRARLPLKEVQHWAETAYFHELKLGGLKSVEMAELLDVSRRKVVQLSNQLKTNFAEVEEAVTLPRKIEFMLWSGPQTEGRIVQAFTVGEGGIHEEEEVQRALVALVEEGRAQREAGRPPIYRVPARNFRLYQDNLLARLDGLSNLLDSLARTIAGRFLDDDERAFARTLNFRIRRQDLPALRRLYEEQIWPRITELEARVEAGEEDVEVMDLSVFWGPGEGPDEPR